MRTTLLTLGTVLTLAFGAAQAQLPAVQQQQGAAGSGHAGAQAQPRQLPSVGVTSAELEFMLQAASSGHGEVAAAQVALERAQDAGVRAFAQRLLRDHQAANSQLRQIAESRNVALPDEPSRREQGMLIALRGVRASDFDREFLQRAGLEAHREAIALFQQQASRTRGDGALRNFARATLPTLQQHLEMAAGLHAAAAHGGEARAQAEGERGAPRQ